MVSLPLKHMVLYKHGVGFFVRGGEVSGEGLSLAFRKDEINDVLKSLTVFDRAGGKVLGVDYQTPMDRDARLASSSIRLSETGSQRDLLRDLRGRQATVTVENTRGEQETITGRVIGIDVSSGPRITKDGSEHYSAVGILGDDSRVRFFPFDALRELHIHDPQSTQDLSYFLDTNMQEDNRRSVNIRLSGGDHDLVVQYVAPSPTWRVSYRVVAESGKDGKDNRALVQGWGLFDNRLEEDLEDVSVTLVAGQPISFIYDLYESRIPQRPTVQDETRIAPGPIRVAGAPAVALAKAAKARGGQQDFDGMSPYDAARMPTRMVERERGLSLAKVDAQQMHASMAEVSESVGETAEGAESGEFFEYRVTTPVSVRRGESAMVPILSAEIGYQHGLVYNGAKLPNHPVAAMRFANTTGLTLETGPVTVSEDGEYRGEAVMPFTKDGGEVYLPYAVELGVTITEKPSKYFVTTGLSFKGEAMFHEQYHVMAAEYVIENTTPNDLAVTIEAGIIGPDYAPFDMLAPDSETARERRWKVHVPTRAQTSFTRQERMRTRRSEMLRDLRFEQLQRYLENKWLDRKLFDTLSGLLDALRSIERMQGEVAQIAAQRRQLFEQQAQLRENLNALQGGGDEISLRSRMLSRLEKAQDQLDALDIQENALNLQINETEAHVDQIIASLPQTEGE